MQVNVTLPPGSSLEASNEAAALIDAKFRTMQKSPENPDGDDPALRPPHRPGRAGRARRAGQRQRVHPDHEPGRRPQPRGDPRRSCSTELKAEVPGVEIEAEQPLAHLISHMLSGVDGPDRHQGLRRRPRHAARTGRADQGGDRRRARRHAAGRSSRSSRSTSCTSACGPTTWPSTASSRAYVAEFVQTALQGRGRLAGAGGQRRFDLVVRLEEPLPHRLRTAWAELRLDLPDGRGQVAAERAGRHRTTAVGPNRSTARTSAGGSSSAATSQGRDLASVVADIQQRVRERGAAAGGLLRRVRRPVREPAAGDAADRRPGRPCRSSACSSCC